MVSVVLCVSMSFFAAQPEKGVRTLYVMPHAALKSVQQNENFFPTLLFGYLVHHGRSGE